MRGKGIAVGAMEYPLLDKLPEVGEYVVDTVDGNTYLVMGYSSLKEIVVLRIGVCFSIIIDEIWYIRNEACTVNYLMDMTEYFLSLPYRADDNYEYISHLLRCRNICVTCLTRGKVEGCCDCAKVISNFRYTDTDRLISWYSKSALISGSTGFKPLHDFEALVSDKRRERQEINERKRKLHNSDSLKSGGFYRLSSGDGYFLFLGNFADRTLGYRVSLSDAGSMLTAIKAGSGVVLYGESKCYKRVPLLMEHPEAVFNIEDFCVSIDLSALCNMRDDYGLTGSFWDWRGMACI